MALSLNGTSAAAAFAAPGFVIPDRLAQGQRYHGQQHSADDDCSQHEKASFADVSKR
jgi:hypothetical protein